MKSMPRKATEFPRSDTEIQIGFVLRAHTNIVPVLSSQSRYLAPLSMSYRTIVGYEVVSVPRSFESLGGNKPHAGVFLIPSSEKRDGESGNDPSRLGHGQDGRLLVSPIRYPARLPHGPAGDSVRRYWSLCPSASSACVTKNGNGWGSSEGDGSSTTVFTARPLLQ